jgi:putative iron-dependent peroxidase
MTSDAVDAPTLTPVSQPITAPQTRAAIFLVLTVNPGPDRRAAVRGLCSDLGALVRAVAARDSEAHLSAIIAFGSDAWDPLFGAPRPAALHPFREVHAGSRHAVATPGDILFHIRAERMDFCFELAAQIMARLGDAVSAVDEVHGFRYFDDRDLTGFVDGTENPTGLDAVASTTVGAEDPAFAGGSYVTVQRYLHDLTRWDALSTEAQERIIGRTKLSDIELDDAAKPASAHNVLTTIVENGEPVEILRHNMPFGKVTQGESGTYFIGYARSPHAIEQMIENMFIGRPPGNYDRLLDFTHPVTGTNFFAPSQTFLMSLSSGDPEMAMPPASAPAAARAAPPLTTTAGDGSLAIGSLKGVPQYE